MRISYYLLFTLVSLIFLASCEANIVEIDREYHFKSKYSKVIRVADGTDLNYLDLRVTSDEERLLDHYSHDTYRLSFESVESDQFITDEVKSNSEESSVTLPKVGLEVIDQNFDLEKDYYLIYQPKETSDDNYRNMGCNPSWAEDVFDSRARAVETRNLTSKLCNDFNVLVSAPSLGGIILADYWSKKKHGQTWTYYPPTASGSGLLVEIKKEKRANYSINFTY